MQPPQNAQAVAQRFPHGVWFVSLIGVEGTGTILAQRLATAVADAIGCVLTGTAPPTTTRRPSAATAAVAGAGQLRTHPGGADVVVDLLRRARRAGAE